MIGLAFSGCRDEYERKRLLQNTKTATVLFLRVWQSISPDLLKKAERKGNLNNLLTFTAKRLLKTIRFFEITQNSALLSVSEFCFFALSSTIF